MVSGRFLCELIFQQANTELAIRCSILDDRETRKAALLELIPPGYRGSPVTNVTLSPELVLRISVEVWVLSLEENKIARSLRCDFKLSTVQCDRSACLKSLRRIRPGSSMILMLWRS